MAQTYGGGALAINAVGTTITTSGASASATVPTDGSGNQPNYVRIAATAAAYVKIGVGTVTATTNDILVQPADAIILQVPRASGAKVAAIQDSAAGKVNVVALDNS